MSHKWKDVRQRRPLSPQAEARIKARVSEESARIPLAEVRRARAITQVRLAELLSINQAAISKMERRADMYLSTLRSYIEAMGGSLELRAVFPDGEVELDTLAEHEPRSMPQAKAGHRRPTAAGRGF